MRRTVLVKSIAAISLTTLCVAIGACASSEPVDGNLNGIGQDKSTTIPAGSSDTSKLPPSNPSKSDTPADAGTSVKDSGSTPKDSGTSTPVDSGSSTSPGDCDPNDPLLFIKLLAASGASCPCSASECCLQSAQLCLPN